MVQVSIFHNVSRDASFGLNVNFRKGPVAPDGVTAIELSEGGFIWKDKAQEEGERHELVWVFQYKQADVPLDTQALLNDIYRLFNVGDDPGFGTPSELAQSYRARKLRSLSVGDVVLVGSDYYSCESCGWSRVQAADLRILPASDAEKVIRARYEFGPREVLAVTVPLPD